MAAVEHIVGIDLGTTNSVVAVIENGTPTIILNTEGQPKTPSVVAFMENGDPVVGEIARRQAATQPNRTISSAKRLIGRLKQEIDDSEEIYPFELGENPQGMVTVVVDGRHYMPEQISALVLDKLKRSAEEYLGQPVKKVIITVPAYFDDLQRQATLRAADLAGLEVMRLINEPTAAAMAYGLNKSAQETVAIYDFGGGTFDVTFMEIDDKTFEVMNSTGNSRLGGDDFDMAIVDYIADRFLSRNGVDLRTDAVTLRRLKDECERAKCELSTTNSAVISLPFIVQQGDRTLHLEEPLSRETLESLVESLVEETLVCCRQAIKESGLRKSQVAKVILVGGTTRTPIVQDMVEDFFGNPPFRGVNPDEVVAIGAAMQGAVLTGELEEVLLLDVTPHTLSIEVRGNRRSALVEKNSTIPIKAYKTFTTTEDGQNFVNVHLLQGEEEKASDCRSLGKFTLSGIPDSKSGAPRIRVEIFVNADGVVEVSALESHSGNEQKLVTSWNYLNAEERRSQGAKSAVKRRKKSVRRGSDDTVDQRRKMLAAQAISEAQSAVAPAVPVPMIAPLLGAASPAQSGSDTARRVELSSSFSMVDTTQSRPGRGTPAPVPAGASPIQTSREFPPLEGAPPSIVLTTADTQTTVRPPSAPFEIPEEALGEPRASALPAPTAVTAPRPPAIAGQPIMGSLPDPPFQIRDVADLLNSDRNDEDACRTYLRDKEAFLAFCQAREDELPIQCQRVKFLTYAGLPDEALEAISALIRRWPGEAAAPIELLGLLLSHYPNFSLARQHRAAIAQELGDFKLAIEDLEYVSKREDSAPVVFDNLVRLYEQALEGEPDPTVQFKLVKLYLRKGQLDEAISLLQQLVQMPEHRNRANKVMGFCFWQKGLRYLAWQKFKGLPVDTEMKETLYRLSTDMEKNDELVHCSHILERIIEVDIGFRDCGDRLKKISYRVNLMKDQRYGVPDSLHDEALPFKDKPIAERFDVLQEINRGSMGIVYKARDKMLDEIVALKVLNDFLCSDPHSVKRFKAEARSARRLTHSHIVRIHDFYDLDQFKAISMEYIEGEDMRTILGRNVTLNEEIVRMYLRQICEALAYAHRLGIVHRDIKPANIMIDEQNQVKVTDFGIAKVLNAAATKSGTMIVGTPLYMAPEQIDGRSIDQRADVYSLGVMLYEMVAGSPPFFEGNIEYQHLHKPVPPITAGITEPLREVIYKCLQKNPDDRFQVIDEILGVLA